MADAPGRTGPFAPSAAHVQRNLTRLTFGQGLQTDSRCCLRMGGSRYASDRAGNFDIWVQPVASGDPVQVTKDPDWRRTGVVTRRAARLFFDQNTQEEGSL